MKLGILGALIAGLFGVIPMPERTKFCRPGPKGGRFPQSHGMPGAKLARMASENRIGLRHPTSLRVVGGRVTLRELAE